MLAKDILASLPDGVFIKGQLIIAVSRIRNHGHAIPARKLDTAIERMRDWKERHEL